jgi:tetratricopeptide (TPR) repeat protein
VVYEANAYQGGEHYQSAFYVYEELATAPSTSAALSIVGQAVAELHLGRLPEAEAALSMALEKYPDDVQLIANAVVLNVLAGKTAEELESYVSRASVSRGCEANAYPLLDVFDRSSRIMLFWRMPRRGVRSLIPLLPSTPRGWHPSRAHSSYEWIRYDLTALPVNACL